MEQNMQYIYQVYQDGSFTKAAEKALSYPACSKHCNPTGGEENGHGAV